MFNKDGESNPFSLEAQINHYALFGNAVLQKTTDLVELHMALGRSSLKEAADGQRRLLAATDLNQYLALTAVLAQENLQRGLGYARDFSSVVTKRLPQNQATASAPNGKAAGRSA
jgi:phasin family protein